MAKKEPAPATSSSSGGSVKDFFIGLLTGVFLCGLVGGYIVLRKKPAVQEAQNVTANAIRRAVNAADVKMEAWHLTSKDIEAELTKTGKVVRRQISDFRIAVTDATSDARITATIKAKYALDKGLTKDRISVSTTGGNVTLTGTAASYENIGRAILLAKETASVRDVIATVKVKSPNG
jgi:osmotically-inducible protein OsmY